MQQHFEKFQIVKEDLGVTDEDTWNMDETGFRIGCGKTHWVISTHAKKPLLLIGPDNRDYITSIETISDGGRDIPPIVILAGINILEKWVKNNLPDDIGFATIPLAIQMMILLLHGLNILNITVRKVSWEYGDFW